MQIGDKVRRRITSSACCETMVGAKPNRYPEEEQVRTGTVVWIHPKGRTYTVEFRIGKDRLRETYRTGVPA